MPGPTVNDAERTILFDLDDGPRAERMRESFAKIDWPKATWQSVGINYKIADPVQADTLGPEEVARQTKQVLDSLDRYLADFLPLEHEGLPPKMADYGGCPCCAYNRNPHRQFMSGLIHSFGYGIMHGKGDCNFCHWAGKRMHAIDILDEKGEKIAGINITRVLWYRPAKPVLSGS